MWNGKRELAMFHVKLRLFFQDYKAFGKYKNFAIIPCPPCVREAVGFWLRLVFSI